METFAESKQLLSIITETKVYTSLFHRLEYTKMFSIKSYSLGGHKKPPKYIF